MPTINFEQSDHRVPFFGHNAAVVFVKLWDVDARPYGRRHSARHTAVHIENERDRPYGGQSLTYCGRLLETGSYTFVRKWHGSWHTCKTCHARAMKRVYEYREVVEARADKQLTLEEATHECHSCALFPPERRMKAVRKVGEFWYCFVHGMDIYCD